MSFENVEEVDGDNPFDDEEGDAFAAASGTDGDEALDWADIEDDDAPASKADMAADKQKAGVHPNGGFDHRQVEPAERPMRCGLGFNPAVLNVNLI